MAIDIRMPKLSDTMEEGTILAWKIKPGDHVSPGDIIAEVETDKAAMEMEAYDAGTVASVAVEAGQTVAVGTVLAVLDAAQGSEAIASDPKKGEAPKAASKGEPEPSAAKEGADQEKGERRGKEAATEDAGRVAASPAARQLAQERGVDLAHMTGSGPGGRIVVADVEAAATNAKAGETGIGTTSPPATGGLRQIVASKMLESWRTTPHFFVTVAVDMAAVERLRGHNGAHVTDYILAACGRALSRHPRVNSWYREGQAQPQATVAIAMAVATDRGLYNPVLRGCDQLSVEQVAEHRRDLVARATKGGLRQDDLRDGTFTLSNLGMMGVESFTAIITPPQVAALAVGQVREEVVRRDGVIYYVPMMRLTLSADHRSLDGADAAAFLATVRQLLEAPLLLD